LIGVSGTNTKVVVALELRKSEPLLEEMEAELVVEDETCTLLEKESVVHEP
jgi:hypothetical protein